MRVGSCAKLGRLGGLLAAEFRVKRGTWDMTSHSCLISWYLLLCVSVVLRFCQGMYSHR